MWKQYMQAEHRIEIMRSCENDRDNPVFKPLSGQASHTILISYSRSRSNPGMDICLGIQIGRGRCGKYEK